MNRAFGRENFAQAEQFLKDGNFQTMVEKSVEASKDFCDRATTAATEGTKAVTEIADTAWGSTKLLNEKLVQNVARNLEITFAAARDIAAARSLPEIGKIQTEFLQKFAAQATEQTKEFVDLSTRATQHVFEKAQAVVAKSSKSVS
jgi:phasin family protein